MSYIVQNFADGEVLHAQHINHIESGILALEKALAGIQGGVADVADIADLRTIINYKKDITCSDLIRLSKCSEGDVYKLVDTVDRIEAFNRTYNLNFSNESFIFCRKSFSSQINNIPEYWSNRTSFLQEASKGYSGIVTSNYQEFSGKKVFDSVETPDVKATTATIDNLVLSSPTATVASTIYVIPKEGELNSIKDSVLELRDATEDNLNEVEEQISLLRKTLDDILNNADNPIALQQKVKELDTRLTLIESLNLDARINELWKEVEGVVDINSFEDLKDTVEDLEKDINAKADVLYVEGKINAIDNSIKKLDQSIKNNSAKITALETSYTDVQDSVNTQRNDIIYLQTSLAALEQAVSDLKDIINSGDFPVDPDSPGADPEEIRKLQEQINGLSVEIEKLNGRVTTEVAQASEDLTTAYTAADTAIKSDVTALDSRLSTKLTSLENKIGTSTTGLIGEVNDLEDELDELSRKVTASEVSIGLLQESDESLNTAIYGDSSSEDELEQQGIYGRLANVEAKNATINTTVSSLEKRVANEEASNTTQSATIAANKSSIDKLDKRVTTAESDIKTNKKEAQKNLEASYGLIDTYTQAEYNYLIATGKYEINRLYAINSGAGTRITKIYLGSVLLAVRDESGNTSFPYTFPIKF